MDTLVNKFPIYIVFISSVLREVLQSNKITCQVFLFLLRQAGKQLNAKDLKTLSLDRPHTIPQNHSQFDFGITATLLIQAHAVGGIDVWKCIT